LVDFVPEIIEEDKLVFDIKSKPETLENFWAVVTKIKRHPFISYAIGIYLNDDFPEGTIIVSPYFYHKYPDFYVVYDKNNRTMRLYANPVYRGNRYWEYFAFIFRNFFYFNLNLYTDLGSLRTDYVHKMYLRLKESVLEKSNLTEENDNSSPIINESFSEKDIPRDPCFPYIWYNQRIGEKNE